VIYIPGDNDIGGENGDQIRISVTDRFREMFEEKETWNYQNRISFYNINRITHDMPTVDDNHVDLEVVDQIRVLLSHYQLLYIASNFAEEVWGNGGKLPPNNRI
jgi:ethanolamine phosphate phosphodiesterase